MANETKHIHSFDELKTKAGMYPIYVGALAVFDFHSKILDIFKYEAGITLRASKISFPFPVAQGLPKGSPVNELLLVDIEYIDIFKKWMTSYRLVDSVKRDYHSLTPTYSPISDPIIKASGKVVQNEFNLPITLEAITYSGTKGALAVVNQLQVNPPPNVITFKLMPPDPMIVREATAYFQTKGLQ